ncbi:MAG: hypothetical protein Q9181_003861 [Wetmoreana brouardii]
MPVHIYRTLLTRQHSLLDMELNCTEGSIDEMVGCGPRSLLKSFKKTKRLQLMPGRDESLPQAARRFFQEHREIEDLRLDFSHMRDDIQNAEANVLCTSSGAMQAFFADLEPSTVCLRILTLVGVDLRGNHRDFLSAVDLRTLSELFIFSCQHPEDFLAALNGRQGQSPITLKELTVHHSRHWQPLDPGTGTGNNTESNRLLIELDTLMRSTSDTLEMLAICLRGYDKLPSVTTIAQHGKKLEELFIDVRKQKGPWAITYSLEEWQTLCSSLKNIRQLNAPYPPVVADADIDGYPEFRDYVELRDFQVPRSPTSRTETPNICKASDLVIITFGLNESLNRPRNWGYGLGRMSFVRSRVHIQGAYETVKMEPMQPYIPARHRPYDVTRIDFDGNTHDIGQYEIGDDDEF